MEYSEDIVIDIKCDNTNKNGQAKGRFKLNKKHKIVITIIAFSGILVMLDSMLIYNFINTLQKLV